jgi:hypothetical protein
VVLADAVRCGLQIRVRDLSVAAAATSSPLPPQYMTCYRGWLVLGWPCAYCGSRHVLFDGGEAELLKAVSYQTNVHRV